MSLLGLLTPAAPCPHLPACRYSDEDLLLPLLDTAVGKLPEFTPKAVVELVRGHARRAHARQPWRSGAKREARASL